MQPLGPIASETSSTLALDNRTEDKSLATTSTVGVVSTARSASRSDSTKSSSSANDAMGVDVARNFPTTAITRCLFSLSSLLFLFNLSDRLMNIRSISCAARPIGLRLARKTLLIMGDRVVLPSVSSLSAFTISDTSRSGFGYNPAVGPNSNAITADTLELLLSKRPTSVAPTSLNSIYDRNITSSKPLEINLSSLSFLFCEIVSWTHRNSRGIQDLENRLNTLGYQVGQRSLELVKLREGKHLKREIRIIEILQFIHGPFWRALFGKTANELEKSQDIPDEYMITENIPVMAKFISIPKEYGNLNVLAYVAGIIEGALDSAGFHANVTSHTVSTDEFPLKTVFLIKFDHELLEREAIRG